MWSRVAQKVRAGQLRSSQRTLPYSTAQEGIADYAEEEKHAFQEDEAEAADNEHDYQLVTGSINDAGPRSRRQADLMPIYKVTRLVKESPHLVPPNAFARLITHADDIRKDEDI